MATRAAKRAFVPWAVSVCHDRSGYAIINHFHYTRVLKTRHERRQDKAKFGEKAEFMCDK